ncbi:hypothetical protein NA57DRAFT_81827 [Rhizodiscina lignyota]|uniref:Secreted protein n=1 Tax=Rhizodiscina lignyota TaxID=1504668 RepID=A0A9P4I6X3_9PEZI|nr:hypothetical protein NA57DRAFT_81827 [Rhizodiscina lignyota]
MAFSCGCFAWLAALFSSPSLSPSSSLETLRPPPADPPGGNDDDSDESDDTIRPEPTRPVPAARRVWAPAPGDHPRLWAAWLREGRVVSGEDRDSDEEE